MNALNARQADALTELINIAFGLTAAKLSQISGHRVVLGVPVLSTHPMESLPAELGSLATDEVVAIQQGFTGPFSGDAILFLAPLGAAKLANLLVEEHLRSQSLDFSTDEILTEVGNMLLSACLGVFGNLLEVRVSFATPRLHLESLERVVASLSISGDEQRNAIVIYSSFKLRDEGVDGRIVIVLGVSSLDRLVQAVERWEGSQTLA